MFMFKPKWLPCMNLCHYRALSYRAYLYLLTLNSQFMITKFTKSVQHTPYLSCYLWCLHVEVQRRTNICCGSARLFGSYILQGLLRQISVY